MENNKPFFPISMTAKAIGITPDRLRTYEEENLIKPFRDEKGKRLFSQNDMQYLICLRKLIHEHGICIQGLKLLLQYANCSELIKKVSGKDDCGTCGLATNEGKNV